MYLKVMGTAGQILTMKMINYTLCYRITYPYHISDLTLHRKVQHIPAVQNILTILLQGQVVIWDTFLKNGYQVIAHQLVIRVPYLLVERGLCLLFSINQPTKVIVTALRQQPTKVSVLMPSLPPGFASQCGIYQKLKRNGYSIT